MKIDLHNHTALSSPCSQLNPLDLIHRAANLGLDGVCVTEHDSLEGGRITREMGQKENFLVIVGQEVSTREGDILAFGLEKDGLRGIPLRDLCRLAQEQGAVLIPAHPYRTWVNSIGNDIFQFADCFVAIEGLNGNCGEQENRQAILAGEKLCLPLVGGSDSHSKEMVGRFYTEFREEIRITDTPSLIDALKTASYKAVKNPLFKES